MSGADAAAIPRMSSQPVHIERPARVLLGWLSPEEAQRYQSGRGAPPPQQEDAQRAERAREAVAARAAGLDQNDVISDPPAELNDYIQRLQEPAAAYFREGWHVAIADLSKVCAVQPSVFVDHAEQRTSAVDSSDITSVAATALPLPVESALPVQFDEARQTWVISSPNPNLRIVGHWSAPLQAGVFGLGFGVTVTASFLQVARFQGRFVLRDGYHRAYGFRVRGITRVPTFVREFPHFQDLGLGAGLLSQGMYMGDRPPLLPDYLDDAVSALVAVPAVQKMIVVAGIELTPLA